MDVLPDVKLGPVRDREDPDALPLGLAGIVQLPQLGALVLGVPAVVGRAEREHPLFRAGFFLVAARATEGHVEIVFRKRLLQPLGLPHVGVQRAVVKGVDALFQRLGVVVDDQLHPGVAGGLVAQVIHRPELPGGVDMQKREGRRRRVEGLLRQMQHAGAVLAHRIKHDGVFGIGHHLAHDVDAFGLKPLQVGQRGLADPGRGAARRHGGPLQNWLLALWQIFRSAPRGRGVFRPGCGEKSLFPTQAGLCRCPAEGACRGSISAAGGGAWNMVLISLEAEGCLHLANCGFPD